MKKQLISTIIPIVISVVIFLGLSYAYFPALLEGKELSQHDKSTFKGMSKEIVEYREKTGEEALWTNQLFSGMPSTLISTIYPGNKIKVFNKFFLFAKRPASQMFLVMTGTFIAMLLFGLNPWLSLIGAIAFGFSSYNPIILSAGHNTKIIAMGYMGPIIGGVYYAFRKKWLLGTVITGLFLALQINAGHLQITYYTMLIILIYGIFELINVFKTKEYIPFLKTLTTLSVIVILAVGTHFASMWATYEYGKFSNRGKSELTHDEENQTEGVDISYATGLWSYGIAETMTVLIPNFHGGPTYSELSTKSESYKVLSQIQGPANARNTIKYSQTYWGDQQSVSPVYFGAIVIFLFVLGLYLVKGRLKWWLVVATVLSLLLSWGQNFLWFTELFLHYFPGYNKFRAVSMTLVIAQFTVPLLGFLALKEVFSGNVPKEQLVKSLKNTFYIVGGFCLFFVLLPGLFFDFESPRDADLLSRGATEYISALRLDRKMLLRNDSFRSFAFIALGAIVIWAFVKDKLKMNYAIAALGLLILVDLWAVDKRYLNDDNFVTKKEAKTPYQMTAADQFILQDKDPNYRVYNITVGTWADGSTMFYHKSIGGYHGAKMRRYEEIIEHQISKGNIEILNMLNAKYFIVPGQNRQPVPRLNPYVLGNAWFVNEYEVVENADAELNALTGFNPSQKAVLDKRFEENIKGKSFVKDTVGSIKLVDYKPNHLTYEYSASSEQLVVFSEIYYPHGWIAKIDGKETDHFRVNYILRSLIAPAGEHTIEFEYKPKSYFVGNKISLASSILLILLFFGVVGFEIFKYLKKE